MILLWCSFQTFSCGFVLYKSNTCCRSVSHSWELPRKYCCCRWGRKCCCAGKVALPALWIGLNWPEMSQEQWHLGVPQSAMEPGAGQKGWGTAGQKGWWQQDRRGKDSRTEKVRAAGQKGWQQQDTAFPSTPSPTPEQQSSSSGSHGVRHRLQCPAGAGKLCLRARSPWQSPSSAPQVKLPEPPDTLELRVCVWNAFRHS